MGFSSPPWRDRHWRVQLRPFRGMWDDICRRLPFYLSDWRLARGEGKPRHKGHNLAIMISSMVQIYFLNLIPALAFVLEMYEKTDGAYGVNEALFASALAAVLFALLSCQPLQIVGVTGLIGLVNFTQYNIFVRYLHFDQSTYLMIQAWVLIWAAIFHIVAAIVNLCDYARFFTEMTADTFGLYVGVVYCSKGVELLMAEFEHADSLASAWFSTTLAILFFVTEEAGQHFVRRCIAHPSVRRYLSAHLFAVAILFWTGFTYFGGPSIFPLRTLPLSPAAWRPTLNRPWLIPFWQLDTQWVFVAMPLGLLVFLLFYFDHNVSAVMAQARRFPVQTPAGFHWDFFLLGVLTLISGLFGLPAPNGLVPQAPDHTASLCGWQKATVVLPVTGSPTPKESVPSNEPPTGDTSASQALPIKSHASGERKADYIVEQRLSPLLIGVLIIATMSNAWLSALGTIPRAIFAGVCFVIGWNGVESNPIIAHLLSLVGATRPERVNVVRTSRGAHFLLFLQIVFFAVAFGISQSPTAAIGFPVVITLMIPLRSLLLPKLGLYRDSHILVRLDPPVTETPQVLASIGGPL